MNILKFIFISLITVSSLLGLPFLGASEALAQVQIFPTRLTLSDQNVSGYLNLRNASESDRTFELQLVFFQMRPDGSVEKQAQVPSSHPLVDRLKFSPSRVTLAPGEKQVVRVMMSEFEELPKGESYIHLQVVPDKSVESQPTRQAQSGASLQLNARVAVAVPIIFRKGVTEAVPQILEPRYWTHPGGGLQMQFKLQRKGEGFIVGDLSVFKKTDQTEELLTSLKGVSSYIDQRLVTAHISADELERISALGDSALTYKFASNSDSAQPFLLEGRFERSSEIVSSHSRGKRMGVVDASVRAAEKKATKRKLKDKKSKDKNSDRQNRP
jgi:fimbrial chaperone protein